MISGKAVPHIFDPKSGRWNLIGSAAAPKPAATKTAAAPKAAKPAAPAKPKNPVLEAFVTYFGATRGAVLYCNAGADRATMADCQKSIREDLQTKAAAKDKADQFNARLNSGDPTERYAAAQEMKLRAKASR